MFDYSLLDNPIANLAQGAAERIKSRAKPTAQNAVEIGQDLQAVKDALPHGQWGSWLQAEFGWSDRTARRYIKLAEMFKSDNLSDLEISLSALHLLASPSVDEDTRSVALELARENGGLTYRDARGLISPQAGGSWGGSPNDWSYEPPQPNPNDEYIFTAATATITATHRRVITDEMRVMMEIEAQCRAERGETGGEIIEWPAEYQSAPPEPEIPKSLTKPLYINPAITPLPALVQAMDYLNHIYHFKTGRYYFSPTN